MKIIPASDGVPLYKVSLISLLVIVGAFVTVSVYPAGASTASAVAQETEADRTEILWLARALYSETKVESEQRLVAWVIRNRVESGQYPDTYQRVVRARGQFSGLSPRDKQYGVNVSMNYGIRGRGWDSALAVAREVYFAESGKRSLGKEVTHFYSPEAVSKTPSWAAEKQPVHVVRDYKNGYTRFAFYANIR